MKPGDIDALAELAKWFSQGPLELDPDDPFVIRVSRDNESFPGSEFATFHFDDAAADVLALGVAVPELVALARRTSEAEERAARLAGDRCEVCDEDGLIYVTRWDHERGCEAEDPAACPLCNGTRSGYASMITRERDALAAALREIAYDPHCAYPEPHEPSASLADSQYKIGIADGHRCAAEKARAALKLYEVERVWERASPEERTRLGLETCTRLGIDVGQWSAEIRNRVSRARAEEKSPALTFAETSGASAHLPSRDFAAGHDAGWDAGAEWYDNSEYDRSPPTDFQYRKKLAEDWSEWLAKESGK